MAINPYRQFPIYDASVIDHYRRQRRADRPPHIFAVADAAYRSLVESHRSQSILITGESGAGKTENTKRVIQYLASVAGSSTESDSAHLDQQLIQANPILEAFGNAQTVRNNNSSRFGKFVRIEFNSGGVICGGNIEKYLLEKSRITHRHPHERSFHIFYQFLRGAPPTLKTALGIEGTVEDYHYTKTSNHTVEGVDDRSDFNELVQAMRVLGFTEDEQQSYFRVIAAILLLGNLSFSEEAAHDQAQLVNYDVAERVCACLGVRLDEFARGLLNPVLKAGRDEVVAQARDMSQVVFSVEALSRTLYDRMFTRLVERINRSIMARGGPGEGVRHFVGVLDIAGFEIFERNSFEQLCINYTNEKLQQFFNHHMFVTEQDEYKKEGLDWQWIDFGLDLQSTIDLLEKSNPIGILACLDEDCVVPRATDRSFCEKIGSLWKGKSGKFEAMRFGDGFIIHHYAGKVEYRTDGWLVKNKDPLNDNITKLLARSSDTFIASLFTEFAGSDEDVYLANKGVKKGLFRTIAQKHRESLALLMQTLNATQPHFVRCILPNEQKTAGLLKAPLVLDQLRCNGVLEGIRICRQGFPHRLPYGEFLRRYECLGREAIKGDIKEATSELFHQLGLAEGQVFRLGQTKVFLRAGELAKLEEMRDHHLSTLLKRLQATFRAILARRRRTRIARQQGAVHLLQRNIRAYLKLRQWPWWKLFTQIRPLLNVTRTENRIHELEAELARISLDRDQQVEQIRGDLSQERNLLYEAETKRRDLERESQSLSLQLQEALESKAVLVDRKLSLEVDIARLKERITTELDAQREQIQGKLATMEQEMTQLRETLAEQKGLVATLRGRIDESEFERIKLEKSEAAQRQKALEAESSLQEALRARKDLELKVKQLEEARRKLQEQLEDETADQAVRQKLRQEWEQQVKQIRQQHEDELVQREEEWDASRKRIQREIHQLNFDLEQEKKAAFTLKETIKRYESGADSLATQLEAEMRNQNNWKRERERLEQRTRELSRLQQEALEREDTLASQVSSLYEQIREVRAKALDAEELVAQAERQRKSLEAKYDALNDTYRETLNARQTAEKSATSTEMQLQELASKLHDEQDSTLITKEQIRILETSLKLAQTELDTERRQSERLEQEKAILEMQIKDLQLKLLDSETSTAGSNNSHGLAHRRASSTYSQILTTIESEGQERQHLLKECRRQERLLRDLQGQLADRDRQRIGLEESLDKGELKVRKLQTTIEALEMRSNDLEVVKRRTERDLLEERDRSERLTKECERLKSRLQVKPTLPIEESTV